MLTAMALKQSFFLLPWTSLSAEGEVTTVQASHQVVPNNSAGHVFLEISSRTCDHKQGCTSAWCSGSPRITALTSGISSCLLTSCGEAPGVVLGTATRWPELGRGKNPDRQTPISTHRTLARLAKTRSLVFADPNKCCKHMKRLNFPSEKSTLSTTILKPCWLPHLGLSCMQICLKMRFLEISETQPL